MKFNLTLLSEKSRRAYVLFGLLSGAAILSSCSHNDPQPIPDRAAFSVVNASPTKTSVDFYLDNEKLPSNLPLAYGNVTRYFVVIPPGSKTAKVTVAGNSTSIGTQKITLENDRFHSLYLTNSGDTVSVLRVRDDWSNLKSGNAQVRFINLSPGAPNYSLTLADDTTAFNNRAYREYSAFKYVPAKTSTTLTLKNTATNETVATLPNVVLKDGDVYTVWAKGLATQLPTDTAKRLQITRVNPAL
ncbi:DUF4397 domain-containing protein [Pedobacter sp. MC2016-15]|uniref:DUF4397 domain-containing protein n=1 Tax=Pedobacter sp. MC2016-15 TaxID=2994473 RepID=UPI0022483EF7|nr:DUF4397 domain-containing protein [Pedobacter sp. MC2016-15]MCX2477858.1 DUF4397 domain-containing protein [Pedobacter sp. MC2016-15]